MVFFTVLRNTAAPLVLLCISRFPKGGTVREFLQVLCISRSNCTCQTSFLHSSLPRNFVVQFTPVLKWMTKSNLEQLKPFLAEKSTNRLFEGEEGTKD